MYKFYWLCQCWDGKISHISFYKNVFHSFTNFFSFSFNTLIILNKIHFIFYSSLFFDCSSPNPKSATPRDLRCQNSETSSSCATKKSKNTTFPNSLLNYGERLRNYIDVWNVGGIGIRGSISIPFFLFTRLFTWTW